MQGEKDGWLSIKIIVSGDITNMGILHRDDEGVRILVMSQFDAQSSAFASFTHFSSDSMRAFDRGTSTQTG